MPYPPGLLDVSVDAKPSIQARARCHATAPPGRDYRDVDPLAKLVGSGLPTMLNGSA